MEDRERQVRERAYAIWEREGRPAGKERQHWEQAAQDVDAEQRSAVDETGPRAGVISASGRSRATTGEPTASGGKKSPAGGAQKAIRGAAKKASGTDAKKAAGPDATKAAGPVAKKPSRSKKQKPET